MGIHGTFIWPCVPAVAGQTKYNEEPLVLPLADSSAVKAYPCVISKMVDWCERFRRIGVRVCKDFLFWSSNCDTESFGRPNQPMWLTTQDACPTNELWWQGSVVTSLLGVQNVGLSPHPFWKWRIIIEPAGLEEALYTTEFCTGQAGFGAGSVMAEGVIDKDGNCVGMPDSVQYIGAGVHIRQVQYSVTRDGTESGQLWLCPKWN